MAGDLTLSVVICAHNEQDWLPGTLDSLAQQTRKPDEIIVVDNASTDHTPQVIDTFAARHPELTVRRVYEPVKGLYRARDTGWRAASGSIIVATDADIRFPPEWLRNYAEAFAANPDVIAMTGPVKYHDGPLFINRFAWFFERTNQPEGIGRLFNKMYHVNGGNSAYRRSALEAVDGYRDKPPKAFEDRYVSAKFYGRGYKLRYLWHNPVWHTYRRFQKMGRWGYFHFLFYTGPDVVYADHIDTPSGEQSLGQGA